MHSVSVVFDALLPVLGEIPQHLQWPHADGDVILVCPDLHGNEHHTCMQLLFEDLPLKCKVNGRNKERQRERDEQRDVEATAQGEESNTGCEIESVLSEEGR